MTIKIEFPEDRPDIAMAFGWALLSISGATDGTAVSKEQHHDETLFTVQKGSTAAEPEPEPTDDSKVDLHGVPFNADYCADAKDPFYSTGSASGQWKKKRGVDQADYDAWYASAKPTAADEPTASIFDSSAAFSPAPPAAAPASFNHVGELMAWVSEMQVANKLTQDSLDKAYASAGVTFQDLVGPRAIEAMTALHTELQKVLV